MIAHICQSGRSATSTVIVGLCATTEALRLRTVVAVRVRHNLLSLLRVADLIYRRALRA